MNAVIAVSGRIGSGKTTLAENIAQRFEFSFVSFGNYVRNVAEKRSIEANRENLQNLGQDLINTDIIQFCKNVLYFDGWDGKSSLIVDGIRHFEVYNAIKDIIFPLPLYLFYIDTKNEIRQRRLGNKNLDAMDSHVTELDVRISLPNLADLIIDGSLPLTRNQIFVDDWMRNSNLI